MKLFVVIAIYFFTMGCALFTPRQLPPEVIISCFHEGDPQEGYCKSQTAEEDGKLAIVRCIGAHNQEANPPMRGKCVKKVCSGQAESKDCELKGDPKVLEQYAELATAKLFAADEAAPSSSQQKRGPAKEKGRVKGAKEAVAAATPAPTPIPTATPTPVATATATPTPANKQAEAQEKEPEKMAIKLKKVKVAKRRVASTKDSEHVNFKKVCIAKGDTSAPENLRGKCATRTCSDDNPPACVYRGHKEMFDWVAKAKTKETAKADE